MEGVFTRITNHLLEKPKLIFLIDSAGALLSSLLLFGVLRNVEDYFGMPKSKLTFLAVCAVCLCLFSLSCFLSVKHKWTFFLRIISVANLLYCVLTIVLLIVYRSQLTIIGVVYFFVEIVIVCVLAVFEFKLSNQLRSASDDKFSKEN